MIRRSVFATPLVAALFGLMLSITTPTLAPAQLIGPGQDDFDREVGTITQSFRTLNYEFFVPPGHEDPGDLPMMVYLHGFTDGQPSKQARLNDTMRDLVHATQGDNDRRRNGCLGLGNCDELDEAYSAYLLVPKIPIVEGWGSYQSLLDTLVTDIAERYDVDPNRTYLSGFSNGALVMPDVLRRYPDTYAAGISLSGGLGGRPPRSVIRALVDTPLWFFHARDDGAVPAQWSIDLATALQEAGGDTQLTLVGGGHNGAYEFAFQDSRNEIYPWLFSQSLVPEPATGGSLLLAGWLALAAHRPRSA